MGNKNGKKEPKFHGETETIDLGTKKIGEEFSIYIRTNDSCGEWYRVINENEFKEYIEYVHHNSQYHGMLDQIGASTSNNLYFKGIKIGNTCIKIYKTFQGCVEKLEIYKICIIE